VRLTLLRNATLLVEVGDQRVLVDPALARAHSLPPLSVLRSRPRLNPTVELPPGAAQLARTATAALVTHCRFGHRDHLDGPGKRLLAELEVPVVCQPSDVAFLHRAGINARPGRVGERVSFAGGWLTPVRARHGRGLIGALMGPGVGYLLEIPGEPTLYLSGDTVLTDDVRRGLLEGKPDVAVMHSGTAQLDMGAPILMTLEEQLEFVRLAPGRVIATHLEALNHCRTSRAALDDALRRAGLRERVEIPRDGETI
jgi:L-ascorbate metabolism protein UlaG (beta-lactamase superfamily)